MSFLRPAACLFALAVLPAIATGQVVAYHGVTASAHQTQWNTLRPQGYRLLSLSVAGGLANQHYTAVWIRRAGASFSGIHNATYTQYVTWRTSQINAGLRPYLVTASGSGADEVYAAIWVNDGVDAHDIVRANRATFDARCAQARTDDDKLSCAAIYGTASSPLFCGVWVPNPDKTVWGYTVGDSANGYQQKFDAFSEGHGRPVFAAVSDYQQYLSVWQDDQVGSWAAAHDMTSSTYDATVAAQSQLGRFPLFASAGGAGSSARWVAAFVSTDTPIARTLTRTGTAVSAFAAFDTYMTNHMTATDARAASIAITRHGRLVYARGYTYAEPGYPTTQPTSMFRLASCSKPLTAIAAHQLDESLLSFGMGTRVGAYLGLNPADARFADITVAHTIQHGSGIVRDASSWTVANWFNLSTMPVSAWQTALYGADRALVGTPGTLNEYSNVAYTVLGQAIVRGSGKTFERYMREDVAAPLGVTRLWVGGNRRSELRSGEVYYHGEGFSTGASTLHSDGRPLVGQYGGGAYGDMRQIDAPGGLITSTVDAVRLLAGAYHLACDNLLLTQTTADNALAEPVAPLAVDRGGFVWQDLGYGVIAHGKAGTLPGASTQMVLRSDGVAIAVFVNKSESHVSRDSLNNMANAVANWPTNDLFPTYGLPVFQRTCPRLLGATVSRLPSLTSDAFLLDGEVFSGVDRIEFGTSTITSRSSTTWATGWFRIVDDNRIELHPPQGQIPGTRTVRLYNGSLESAPLNVTIESTPGNVLLGPTTTFAGFDLMASRGSLPTGTIALLTFSPSTMPSVANGLVSLDLGNRFAELFTWPSAVSFNILTGVARWQVPDFGVGVLHFQGVLVTPTGLTPLPVTTRHSVRSL